MAREPDMPHSLEAYRAKRSAARTPEPFGSAAASRPRLFVIQKHAARRMHYDFRLEWAGVLLSWAVPRGPSLDPAEKRLAVHVEDHPVEYADFQGIIPAGNYGAGAVIVWDRGTWVPLEDPAETLPAGKLTFELQGYKLRGAWHLFRTGGRGAKQEEWMLAKRPDAWAAKGRELAEESIFTGVTVEELATSATKADEVAAALATLPAPRNRLRAVDVPLMLAETADRPFSRPGWLFELKYDGFRLLAEKDGNDVRLLYRRGSNSTAVFPEVARALRLMPFEHAVLDGEVAVLDAEGRPRFQELQRRVQLLKPSEIERASFERPATLFAFDLLGFGEHDLRPLPLATRKALLQKLVPRLGPVRYCDHVEERGLEFFEAVTRMDLEGMMAKSMASPYRAGRHESWLKVRVERTADFAVVGFTTPRGNRAGFGALHLAAHKEGRLQYAGRAGSGFTEAQIRDTLAALKPHERKGAPCEGPVPKDRGHHWVDPRLVCEVRYTEWTEDGLLRHPVFLRFRSDKLPEDCDMPRSAHAPLPQPDEPAAPGAAPAGAGRSAPEAAKRPVVPFSNLKKVFWPAEGYTKGDLIDYYREISPWLLPFLKDRPVVLTRYPDGIEGKSFFQVDAPSFVPDWLRTERHWSEENQKEVHQFLCDDVESLLYIANMGAIPLHVWASRVTALPSPDWCIFDLDPKGAPIAHVVQIALALKRLLDDVKLPPYVKTSGSTGIHVMVPLGGQVTYQQCRALADVIGRSIVAELPQIATMNRSIEKREGRVYVDTGQNGHGRLIVGPYSVRPKPGAPVSMPLRWEEVTPELRIEAFHIKNARARMEALGEDPLLPILDDRPDLIAVLERLGKRHAG